MQRMIELLGSIENTTCTKIQPQTNCPALKTTCGGNMLNQRDCNIPKASRTRFLKKIFGIQLKTR